MSLPISITESQAMAALRGFLLGVVSDNTQVIRGQDNRVHEPAVNDFVVMTPILRSSRYRNLTDFFDSVFVGQIAAGVLTVNTLTEGVVRVGMTLYGTDVIVGTRIISQTSPTVFVLSISQTLTARAMAAGAKEIFTPTELTVQVDIYGPVSSDNCQTIVTTFRDSYSSEIFASGGLDIFPLYSSEPKQSPFRNGEQQTENRWTVDLALQYNALIDLPMQFFDSILITVDNFEQATVCIDQVPGENTGSAIYTKCEGEFFQFNQFVASDTWIVNHNFGRNANVDVYSLGGVRLLVNVLQISVNQVQILFDSPSTGFAICS